MQQVPFVIHYSGDAYSTAEKIMGRQSSGKSFIRAIAQTWKHAKVHGSGYEQSAGSAFDAQLRANGFAGSTAWDTLPSLKPMNELGCMYFPGPAAPEFAFARNTYDPAAFSIMGVTYTLSSARAMDAVGSLVLPPYQPWDALICASQAALTLVKHMHSEMQAWWSSQTGATRFNSPQLPVIPLGIECAAFKPTAHGRDTARNAIGIANDEVAVLFAGRLSMHAKGNPIPMYQALEQAAKVQKIVCLEAGVFPNDFVAGAYRAAQAALAPSVRFEWINGQDEARYQAAWQAADIFCSISDNIQETFGLTPIEAMAAGLPVVVSDWNGYQESIDEGVEGYKIPTLQAPPGCGEDLATRHAFGLDTYDFYIGRTSLATVAEPVRLAEALTALATQPALRAAMGAAGMEKAQRLYDWSVVLEQYAQLCAQLKQMRQAAGKQAQQPWISRADPFARFRHFATGALQGQWQLSTDASAPARLRELMELSMANYAFHPELLPPQALLALLDTLHKGGPQTVNGLLASAGLASPVGVRSLMWLWKFDLLRVHP